MIIGGPGLGPLSKTETAVTTAFRTPCGVGNEVRSFLALEKSCLLSVCYRPPLLLARWRADLGAALPGWQSTRPMALGSTTRTTGTVIQVKSPGRANPLIGWRRGTWRWAGGTSGGPAVWNWSRCGSCQTSIRRRALSSQVRFDLDGLCCAPPAK